MAVDAKTGQAIFGGHNSWGRTRSPKNLAGANGTAVDALANINTLKGITASTAGYLTENQRYLHLLVEETNDGGNTNADAVSVFGYCHAFQRWFNLAESHYTAVDNDAPDALSIDPPNSSTTPANHVPASREYRIYEIVGVDRVAFVATNSGRIAIFAACSTF
jgi:hypothetical protein